MIFIGFMSFPNKQMNVKLCIQFWKLAENWGINRNFLIVYLINKYRFTFLRRANIHTFLSWEILGKDIRQLLAIFVFMFLRPRHNAEFHGANFFQENSSVVTCYGSLEIVENRSGDQSGSVGVSFECFEHFVCGDRLRMGSPRVIVRSSSNEGVAEEE